MRRRTYRIYMQREPVASSSHCQLNVRVSGKRCNHSKLVDDLSGVALEAWSACEIARFIGVRRSIKRMGGFVAMEGRNEQSLRAQSLCPQPVRASERARALVCARAGCLWRWRRKLWRRIGYRNTGRNLLA